VPVFLLVHERFHNSNGDTFGLDGSLSVLPPEFRCDSAAPLSTLEELGVRHNDGRRSDSHLHLHSRFLDQRRTRADITNTGRPSADHARPSFAFTE
jgi:hypothetical protein